MKSYYYRESDYDKRNSALIIDETTYNNAVEGRNYLVADAFNFLCDANSTKEAREFYDDMLWQSRMDSIMESAHA